MILLIPCYYSTALALCDINNIKIISVILHRRATSPGGGAGRRDLDHVSVAAGAAFAPGRLAIALPVQEQGAKNTLFFASYSILSVAQHDSVGSDSVALNCYAMGSERRGCPAALCGRSRAARGTQEGGLPWSGSNLGRLRRVPRGTRGAAAVAT